MPQQHLVNLVTNIIKDPVKGLKLNSNDWDKDEVALPFSPSVISGGSSCVGLGDKSSTENISSDVIMLQLGVQYSEGIVAIGRTFFVNGTPAQNESI